MKLWVADNVLTDWSSGLVVIHAKSQKEAIELFFKKDSTALIDLYNWPECNCKDKYSKEDKSQHFFKHHKPNRLPNIFKLITKPEAFTIWGGG